MSTITFGSLGDVIFEMVVAGAPLPFGKSGMKVTA